MTCQICICAATFIVIMLFCWATHNKKKSDSQTILKENPNMFEGDPTNLPGDIADIKTKWVQMDSTSGEVIKPPIEGPPLGEYPVIPETTPASRHDERHFMELPRGGLSCPNKRWYDAIYNGGAETVLDEPDSFSEVPGIQRRDVKNLWAEDAIVRRRETRMPRMVPSVRHGMMV